jgi:methionine-rich copper-binding protein CopC
MAEVVDGNDQTIARGGRNFEVDSTAPTVSSTFPKDGTTGVSTSTMVMVTFDEGMAEASADVVSITGPGTPNLGTPTWSGTQLTFETTGLQPNSQYTVTVGTDATDDSVPGNAMAGAETFSFTVGNGDTPTPPIVTGTTPSHDATGVSIVTKVRVTFSKGMDTTATQAALSVSPDVSWSPTWADGNTVLTVNPDTSLQPNIRYSFIVADTALASDGTSLTSPYSFHFTTGDPPDLLPPSVLDNYPPDRQREIDPAIEEITITFSEPMDTAATEAALSISTGTITSKTWRVEDTVLALKVDLVDDERYTITVGTSASDKSGNRLTEEFSFYFVTKQSDDPEDERGLGSPLAPMVMLSMLLVGLLAAFRRRM